MTEHTNQQVTALSISGYALLHNGSNALRCFGSSSFALGNYPTYCLYRRGHQVNAKSRIQKINSSPRPHTSLFPQLSVGE